jgi:hypothetical protein
MSLLSFWKPEKVGDSIKGKFVRWISTTTKDKKKMVSVELDTAYVGVSAAVKRALAPHIATIKPGDELAFTFEGEKASTKGNATKLFAVYLNGELISGWNEANEKEMESFFSEE